VIGQVTMPAISADTFHVTIEFKYIYPAYGQLCLLRQTELL